MTDTPAGRGNPLAEAVARVREAIEDIHRANEILKRALPAYDEARTELEQKHGVKMTLDPQPLERAVLAEWQRRADHEVEHIMPQSLRAVR